MKNKLIDLNDHLFAQIERLSDEDLNPDAIQNEANRAEAIVRVSDQIIKGASLALKAAQLKVAHGDFINIKAIAPMIEGKKNEG